MNARKKLLVFLRGFLVLNVLWYLLSLVLNLRALPPPLAVYARAGRFFADGLPLHVLASLFRVVCSLALALLAGGALGLAMARSGWCDRLLNPLVYLTYPVPKTALLPVVMLLFGLGDPSKILFIALIVVFQVVVVVRGAVRAIPPEAFHYVRSLGATGAQAFRLVTLPAVMPELLTNMKVSAGTALSVLFFAEGYGTREGLGYYIMDAWARIDYPAMYLGILTVGFMGFGVFLLLDAVEERVCRWKQPDP